MKTMTPLIDEPRLRRQPTYPVRFNPRGDGDEHYTGRAATARAADVSATHAMGLTVDRLPVAAHSWTLGWQHLADVKTAGAALEFIRRHARGSRHLRRADYTAAFNLTNGITVLLRAWTYNGNRPRPPR